MALKIKAKSCEQRLITYRKNYFNNVWLIQQTSTLNSTQMIVKHRNGLRRRYLIGLNEQADSRNGGGDKRTQHADIAKAKKLADKLED